MKIYFAECCGTLILAIGGTATKWQARRILSAFNGKKVGIVYYKGRKATKRTGELRYGDINSPEDVYLRTSNGKIIHIPFAAIYWVEVVENQE